MIWYRGYGAIRRPIKTHPNLREIGPQTYHSKRMCRQDTCLPIIEVGEPQRSQHEPLQWEVGSPKAH